MLKIYCDGGSRGNPGPAAYGFVIYSSAGNILEKCGNYLGVTTNNQAEYQGVISALKVAHSRYPSEPIELTLDSLLIVNQLKGLYRVKHPAIIPLFQEAKVLLSKFPSWKVSHTLRSGNALADSLVNQALDRAAS